MIDFRVEQLHAQRDAVLFGERYQWSESFRAVRPSFFIALTATTARKANHVRNLRRCGEGNRFFIARNQPGVVLDPVESIREPILWMGYRGVPHRANQAVSPRDLPVLRLEKVDALHAELTAHLAHVIEAELAPRPAGSGEIQPARFDDATGWRSCGDWLLRVCCANKHSANAGRSRGRQEFSAIHCVLSGLTAECAERLIQVSIEAFGPTTSPEFGLIEGKGFRPPRSIRSPLIWRFSPNPSLFPDSACRPKGSNLPVPARTPFTRTERHEQSELDRHSRHRRLLPAAGGDRLVGCEAREKRLCRLLPRLERCGLVGGWSESLRLKHR